MEIDKILASHAKNIKRYKEEEEKLIEKIRFCTEHNFEEEKRITMVKYYAMNMILYNYQEMFDEILVITNKNI